MFSAYDQMSKEIFERHIGKTTEELERDPEYINTIAQLRGFLKKYPEFLEEMISNIEANDDNDKFKSIDFKKKEGGVNAFMR
jgi:hypothetical protein